METLKGKFISIFLIVSLQIFSLLGLVFGESGYYYATYEGQTSYLGAPPYPVQTLFLISDELFTLTGSLAEEIKWERWNVTVTGMVKMQSSYSNSWDTIEVEQYTINTDSVYGELYQLADGLIIVGDNQNIYHIINPEIIDSGLIGERVLLFGEFEYLADFEYYIEVSGIIKLKYEFIPYNPFSE